MGEESKPATGEKIKGILKIAKTAADFIGKIKELPRIIHAIILAVACLGAGGASAVYVTERSADTEVKRMQSTIASLDKSIADLQANNRQLIADKDGLVATNKSLATESDKQRQTITTLTTELGQQHGIIDLLTAESKRNQQIISDLAAAGRQFDEGLGSAGTDIQSTIKRLQLTQSTIAKLIAQINSSRIQ